MTESTSNINNKKIHMLPPSKASEYLGLSEYYLRNRIKDNSIPCIKSGNRTYILVDELTKQLEIEAKENVKP